MRTVMRKCIFDAASGRAVWQNNFVRTYWGAKTEDVLKPFETCATDLSVQHRLKEFKADHGAQWFQKELNQTVSTLSEHIADLFHDAGY